ncbi:MAG: hypothetical protein IH594_05460, partial [Bacteroidales bacterium]|nr:hypothetical protein [Bacteroidales bacterium]
MTSTERTIPVHIISGFLGSGKTTAIIRLLKEKPPEESWAIVVNEFGKVSIDGQTLRSQSVKGSVFDIAGGCICCSAKGYFRENLETIIHTSLYNRIIIEPSGLGGIEMVTEIIRTFPSLNLMPVICIVDISSVENPRLQGNLIYKAQIDQSDAIVFSKCDLMTEPGELNKRVENFRTSFPGKSVYIPTGQLSIFVLSSGLFHDANLAGYRLIFDTGLPQKDILYEEKTYQFNSTSMFDPNELRNFFREDPCVIRAKGNILSRV